MNRTILRQADFNTTLNDMWTVLVEAAIVDGILPFGTHADDVEELNVQVVKSEHFCKHDFEFFTNDCDKCCKCGELVYH
jgi:hypothetical protein